MCFFDLFLNQTTVQLSNRSSMYWGFLAVLLPLCFVSVARASVPSTAKPASAAPPPTPHPTPAPPAWINKVFYDQPGCQGWPYLLAPQAVEGACTYWNGAWATATCPKGKVDTHPCPAFEMFGDSACASITYDNGQSVNLPSGVCAYNQNLGNIMLNMTTNQVNDNAFTLLSSCNTDCSVCKKSVNLKADKPCNKVSDTLFLAPRNMNRACPTSFVSSTPYKNATCSGARTAPARYISTSCNPSDSSVLACDVPKFKYSLFQSVHADSQCYANPVSPPVQFLTGTCFLGINGYPVNSPVSQIVVGMTIQCPSQELKGNCVTSASFYGTTVCSANSTAGTSNSMPCDTCMGDRTGFQMYTCKQDGSVNHKTNCTSDCASCSTSVTFSPGKCRKDQDGATKVLTVAKCAHTKFVQVQTVVNMSWTGAVAPLATCASGGMLQQRISYVQDGACQPQLGPALTSQFVRISCSAPPKASTAAPATVVPPTAAPTKIVARVANSANV